MNERVTMANAVHPGQILWDCIKGERVTATAVARQLGMSRGNLYRTLSGRAPLTARLALALEHDLGWSNAEFWMRLQANYDLALERRRRDAA